MTAEGHLDCVSFPGAREGGEAMEALLFNGMLEIVKIAKELGLNEFVNLAVTSATAAAIHRGSGLGSTYLRVAQGCPR